MVNKKLRQLLTLFVLSALARHACASDYQAGLIAYLDKNYLLAQQHWLSGAENKDAKSMFNLGLLNEQAKVNGASFDKAMNWFSLAKDNGYSAAAYHMAQRMLDRGGSDDDAIALINHAAEQGYAPAQRYLDISLGSKKHSTHPQAQGLQSQRVLNQASPADLAWIERQPSNNWTIQLLAFTNKNQVERFIEEHGLANSAGYYAEIIDGGIFYKLVYGSYKSKDKADFARQNLSSELSEHGPWLRQWASVHKALKWTSNSCATLSLAGVLTSSLY